MDILILGGTAWLGREMAGQAVRRGHAVTCLARGDSGPVADGAVLVAADRRRDDAYDQVRGRGWDAVMEVSWQPGLVRGALAALGQRAAHWTYVSSVSAYASHAKAGASECEPLSPRMSTTRLTPSGTARPRWPASRPAPRAWAAGGDRAGRAHRRPRRPQRADRLLGGAGRPRPAGPDARAGRRGHGDAGHRRPRHGGWLLDCAQGGIAGTYDAVGPVVPFGHWIEQARATAGHTGPVVEADPAWLIEQGVAQFAGPESLPLWVAEPGWDGFAARSGQAARTPGCATGREPTCRPTCWPGNASRAWTGRERRG